MTVIVFDSDGIIKITKTGLLNEVSSTLECIISNKVYEESVVEGKKRYHEDANSIDNMVQQKKIKIIEPKKNKYAQKIVSGFTTLGKGEISTLHLYFQVKTKAIISDDRAFLNILQNYEIPFIIPSDLIVWIASMDVVPVKRAIAGLDRIASYINESNYLRAKHKLEVMLNE